MERCIFLDRDGVIIKDKHYTYRLEDIEFLPYAVEGLRELQCVAPLVIVTNQAGIAHGYFSLDQAHQCNQEILSRLKAQGINIKKIYLCPHHPEITGVCQCRKPSSGLAQQAAHEHGIDLAKSVFIGDKDSDIAFGKNCAGTTILIQNNEYPSTVLADFTVMNLLEAVSFVKRIFSDL